MGSLIFGSQIIQGRKFDDLKLQKSKAGVPRPIIFGKARPVVGNIIASSSPRIVVKREKQQGGKGGPDVKVENEEIYRTYAIRICEGPVTGISRVWRNGEIVYDRDSDANAQIENNAGFLSNAEFFLGGFDQMPSTVMQIAFGIENVHAYRGTCYMVVDDENLTAEGGAVPQYSFEVERCEGFVLTSRPYAVEVDEFIDLLPSVDDFFQREATEAFDVRPAVEGIELKKVVGFLNHHAGHESLDTKPAIEGIALEQVVIYSEYESGSETLDTRARVEGINLNKIAGYIERDLDTEAVDISPVIDGITLTRV